MPNHDTPILTTPLDHWLTWSALNHFLPIPLLRELLATIVERVSARQINFADLFEEIRSGESHELQTWAVRSKPVDTPLATYLRSRVLYLLWRNDSEVYPPQDRQTQAPLSELAARLEAAISLGRVDFGIHSQQLSTLQVGPDDAIAILANLVREGAERFQTNNIVGFFDTACDRLSNLDAPTLIAIAKHLGDLCADGDKWSEADAFYRFANAKLVHVTQEEWQCFKSSMHDAILQSIASAERTISGPEGALQNLRTALQQSSLNHSPILALNAPNDVGSAEIASGSLNFDLERSLLVEPPFYHGSHDLDSIVYYTTRENFREAQRHCWAVLRRQIALGLAADTRNTKAIFGRIILDDLEQSSSRPDGRTTFETALRLLLESGDSSLEHYNWPKLLVDKYVDESTIAQVSEICARYPGTKMERQRTAIEVFRSWLSIISDEKHRVADQMMEALAAIAGQGEVTILSTHNRSGRSLEILRETGKARPEFRITSAHHVQRAIVKNLEISSFWKSKSEALELAEEFIDVLSDSQTREIVTQTLTVLSQMDPATQMWPIVRPALRVLASSASARISKEDQNLGKAVLDTILRFGAQETESSGLLFYLHDFDVVLLKDPKITALLRPVIDGLRKRVEALNSSATAGEIQALLLSPTISGYAGVMDALQALEKVLVSSDTSRPSIALPYGYAPLQMLVNRQQAFSDELGISREEIEAIWVELFEEVLALWDRIRLKPSLLAPFSIPPVEEPNPTLIHNWTFVSVRFAESVGKRDAMVLALRAAGQVPELRNAIRVALVTGAVLDTDVGVTADEIYNESADVFYANLGRRLILLESSQTKVASELCLSLLKQCARFGPRGLDAGVLVYANRLGIAEKLEPDLMSNYLKRVDMDKQLRLSLMPLLKFFDRNQH